MLITRNLRNLLHTFNLQNRGSDLLEEYFGHMNMLKDAKWDPELANVGLKILGVSWYEGEDELLLNLVKAEIEKRPIRSHSDVEKIHAYIEFLERDDYPETAAKMRAAYNTLRRNNFEVPGFKVL